MFDRRLLANFDWILFLNLLTICLLGVMAIYSASRGYPGENTYWLRQLYWVGLGLGVGLVVLLVDFRTIGQWSYTLHGLVTASLVLSGALSRDSTVKTNILKRQYAALGIGEYVSYLVADPARWDTWKSNNQSQPPGTYVETVTINQQSTDFTVTSLANPARRPAGLCGLATSAPTICQPFVGFRG